MNILMNKITNETNKTLPEKSSKKFVSVIKCIWKLKSKQKLELNNVFFSMNISKYFFKESDMKPEIINQIGKCVDSRLANLANCEIVDEEILEILNKIKKIQPKISEINLDNNKLTDQCAIILEKYLSDFKQLQTLSIQNNQIGRAGAISLFSIKKSLPELDILFHGNRIHNTAEMAEIENIAKQQGLTK